MRTSSQPKYQKTVHIRIRDRESGFVLFGSIKVERHRITLNPTPGLILSLGPGELDHPVVERLHARSLKLASILQKRWWPSVGASERTGETDGN